MAELDLTAGLRGRGAGRVPGPTCTSWTQKVADRDPPLEPHNSISAHRASWISISSSTRVDQCITALVQHYLQQGWMMYTHRKEDNHTAATEKHIPSLQASAIKAHALRRSSLLPLLCLFPHKAGRGVCKAAASAPHPTQTDVTQALCWLCSLTLLRQRVRKSGCLSQLCECTLQAVSRIGSDSPGCEACKANHHVTDKNIIALMCFTSARNWPKSSRVI